MAMSSMCGNTWQRMATHGNAWQRMATHGHLLPHMATLEAAGCALEGLLQDLGSVAQEAAQELGPGASSDEVAAHAVKAGWKEMVTGRSYMEAWGFNSIEDGEDAFCTVIHDHPCGNWCFDFWFRMETDRCRCFLRKLKKQFPGGNDWPVGENSFVVSWTSILTVPRPYNIRGPSPRGGCWQLFGLSAFTAPPRPTPLHDSTTPPLHHNTTTPLFTAPPHRTLRPFFRFTSPDACQSSSFEFGPFTKPNSPECDGEFWQVNVFHTMNFLLRFSESIREMVKTGQVQIQGEQWQVVPYSPV